MFTRKGEICSRIELLGIGRGTGPRLMITSTFIRVCGGICIEFHDVLIGFYMCGHKQELQMKIQMITSTTPNTDHMSACMRLYIHYVQIPSHERQRGGGIQNDGKPNLIRTGLFSREERKPSNNVKRNVNEK